MGDDDPAPELQLVIERFPAGFEVLREEARDGRRGSRAGRPAHPVTPKTTKRAIIRMTIMV